MVIFLYNLDIFCFNTTQLYSEHIFLVGSQGSCYKEVAVYFVVCCFFFKKSTLYNGMITYEQSRQDNHSR